MKTKILVALLVGIIALGAVAPGAVAYDASTPWSGTVRWSIPSDTTFSIVFAGSETQVDFTATTRNDSLLEPDSQSAVGDTPIIVVTNNGNTYLNFTCNLTVAVPTWATIKVSNTSTHGNAFEFTNSDAILINRTVQATESTDLYLWTNLTMALEGNTDRSLEIHSRTSS